MTRHTTMIVGPTGGGKTVALDTLCRAQADRGLPTKHFVINPKAQPIYELYGVLDPATRDWTDGLLSNIFRDMNKPVPEGKDERRCIVYDGDVDAVWVENMNSRDGRQPAAHAAQRRAHPAQLPDVLDALRGLRPAVRLARDHLALRHGVRRPQGPRLAALLLRSGCNTRENEAENAELTRLLDKYLEKCIDFVCEGIEDKATMLIVEPPRTVQPMSNLAMIQQLTVMLTSMLTEERNITDPAVLEAVFLYAITWSLGGGAGRLRPRAVRQVPQEALGAHRRLGRRGAGRLAARLAADAARLPLRLEQRRWRPWSTEVPDYEPPPDRKFSSIIVPTSDTVRSTWLLDSVVSVKAAVLFVGESGTAKTTVVAYLPAHAQPGQARSLGINFSSRTSSMDVQVASRRASRSGPRHVFGPPAGKKLLVFVDDLNMPQRGHLRHAAADCAAQAADRQAASSTTAGRTSRIKYMKDMQFIAAMVPGAQPGRPALHRLFNMFCITFPPEASISSIYRPSSRASSRGRLRHGRPGRRLAGKITSATMSIFNAIVDALPPTPAKFHYIFNLRDLSRITEGIMLATPDKFTTTDQIVRLLRHETLRIFCDRLVGDADKRSSATRSREHCSDLPRRDAARDGGPDASSATTANEHRPARGAAEDLRGSTRTWATTARSSARSSMRCWRTTTWTTSR